MSTKKSTNEKPERHLITGANILIRGFKNPSKFLSFLTDALHWISLEGVSEETGEERIFFLRLIIMEVLQRWINNGERVNESIAIGLKEIESWYGYEGYYNQVSVILKGLATSIREDGCQAKKYLDEYFKGVSVMFELGDYIRSYTIDNDRMREKGKISEAA